jgi:hypothetical protein
VKEEDLGAVRVTCPNCQFEMIDADGFGFVHCERCKLCTHPSRSGPPGGPMVCTICGDVAADPDEPTVIECCEWCGKPSEDITEHKGYPHDGPEPGPMLCPDCHSNACDEE